MNDYKLSDTNTVTEAGHILAGYSHKRGLARLWPWRPGCRARPQPLAWPG